MLIETFPALARPGLRHGFSTRGYQPRATVDDEIVAHFVAAGFPMQAYAAAEQIHGAGVARVDRPSATRVPGIDALITATPGLPLTVRVADCGPVFFFDPVRRAIGLAHSGRRGTEANVVGATVEALTREFAVRPEDLVVQLGPCIRPPRYEVDFAAEIARQAAAAGVGLFVDCGICTAARLDRYYSYRAERGQTGRMWGVLLLDGAEEALST